MYDKSSVRSCVNVSVEFVTLLPSIMIKPIRSNNICCDGHVSDPVIQYHVCKNCLTFVIY